MIWSLAINLLEEGCFHNSIQVKRLKERVHLVYGFKGLCVRDREFYGLRDCGCTMAVVRDSQLYGLGDCVCTMAVVRDSQLYGLGDCVCTMAVVMNGI